MKQGSLIGLCALVVAAGCTSVNQAGHHHAAGSDYCADYRSTMAGKSVEEQRKAAEAHVVRMHGSADAAHVDRHMKMMEQRCGSPAQDRPKG